MKFNLLILSALTLCFSVTLHAKPGIEKERVKTELASHSDALVVAQFDFAYVAEETREVIAELKPALVGEISEGYVSKVYHPPTVKMNRPRYSGRRL